MARSAPLGLGFPKGARSVIPTEKTRIRGVRYIDVAWGTFIDVPLEARARQVRKSRPDYPALTLARRGWKKKTFP